MDKKNIKHENDDSGLYGGLKSLEKLLDEYMIKKAPFTLPREVKEFIVKISPYLIIVLVIMALPIIFAAVGVSVLLAPFAMMGMTGGYGFSWGFGSIISLVVTIFALVMELMAVSGLFKRTKGAWRLVFYASIVGLIGSILSVHGIIGGIIGAIIGWYILFQVKELYKN
jgi:hypothetical protein